MLRAGPTITALEVKSGRLRDSLPEMAVFVKAFHPRHHYVVGGQGIAAEEFLRTPARGGGVVRDLLLDERVRGRRGHALMFLARGIRKNA